MTLRNLRGLELFYYETPDNTGGATPPVPGAGEAAQGDPSASTPPGATPPVADQDPPGPIPYARFSEVNNQRRALEDEIQPFRDLVESGYDADNLQRLAMWEQEYVQDPVGTWLRTAEQIDGLPDEVKAAIAAAGESAASAQGTPPADGTPPQQVTASPDDELRRQVQELTTDREARLQKEQEEAISAFYDGLVKAWKKIDVEQGIVTPDEAIHAHLAAASPNAARAEDILRDGRERWLAVREATLAGAITKPGTGSTVPRSVPGSGGGNAPPVQPRSLAEARRAALEDPMFSDAQ